LSTRVQPEVNEQSAERESDRAPAVKSLFGRLVESGGAAVVLIAVLGVANQLRLVKRAWFFADDLLNFQIARQMGLSWDYLSRSFFGHFLPGHRLLNWAFVSVGGDWTTALYVSMVGLFVCFLLFDWTLRLYGVRTAVRLRSLVWVAFAIPLISSMIWWSAAMNAVPAMLTSLLAIGLYKKSTASHSVALAGAAAASCFVGTTFIEFVAFTPVFVLILESEGWTTTQRGLLRRWKLPREAISFAALTVLLHAAYALYYLSKSYRDESGGPPSPRRFLAYADWAVFRGYGTSLIGLDATRFSHAAQVRLGLLMLLAFALGLAYLLMRFTSNRRVLVAFFVTMALHVTLVGIGRAHVGGPRVGLDHRYFADIVWMLPFTVALATRYPSFRSTAARARAGAVAINVGVVAIALTAANSATGVAAIHPATSAGRYERSMVSSAPVAVLDSRLPPWLLPPIYAPYNVLSGAIEGLLSGVSAGTDVNSRLVVNAAGYVVPVTLVPLATYPTNESRCVSTGAEQASVGLAPGSSTPDASLDRVLLLKGTLEQGAFWVVETRTPGGSSVPFSVDEGPTSFDRSISLDLAPGSTSTFAIYLTPNSTVCFDVAEAAAVLTG
jgi:hypothetical protein